MSPWLLLFLIIIGNFCLYWVLYGKKKFEQKLEKEGEQCQNEP